MKGNGALTAVDAAAGTSAAVAPRRRRRSPDGAASVGSVGSDASVDRASDDDARLRRPGGGAFGTGIGPRSSPLELGPACCAFFTAEPDPARVRFRPAARVAMRLFGPRTGVRAMNTHPTPGTGFPPIRRPSSNSHSYSPWNSWK